MKRKILLVLAVALATAVHAYTVYDAGKAFNEAGHNTNSFGVWSLLHASGEGMGNTKAFDTTTGGSAPFVGIGGSSSPWIRVNTGNTSIQGGEEVLPNELLIHPANPSGGKESYPSDVVRFTAPEAGWYSASIFAHDTSKESGSNTNSGVQVSIRAQGKVLVRQIVSLEDYADNRPTHRFDFQMPVRYLAAGDKIEVVIGNKYNASSAHSSDSTGLRFTVTKEDEGRFYDSGIAMKDCVANAASYQNPYGTIKDGSWYFLTTTVPSWNADLSALAPGNFSRMSSSRISKQGSVSGFAGFGTENGSSIKSPYVVVNGGTEYSANTAPCELQAHPTGADNKKWTTIRFRPPVAGYYSGSVVARHVNWGTDSQWTYTGVDVYLLASEHVVTNAYVFMKDFTSTTAHLTFDARLFAAGEPVDIVISPHNDQHSDATAISAIFRREEGDVYDAGTAYYAEHASSRCSNYFADLLDGNAMWLLAKKTDPWDEAHSALGTYLNPSGTLLTWWTHATDANNNGTPPRFAMATNAIASADSMYLGGVGSPLLATTPYEIVSQTGSPSGSDGGCATLRAEVPSNGIYRVRSYARDLNGNSGTAYDGVRVILSAGGNAPMSAVVSRDNGETYPFEAALSADRLWMKQGEGLHFTVDPRTSNSSDSTGLSACYERTGDATARVINVDITGSDGEGRFSAHVGAGREGWSDWNKWNAMRYSSAIDASKAAEYTIANCREADGTTKRNVAFTLKRDSGANIAKGWSPTGYVQPVMLGIWAKSESESDTYTFTLSNLKASEPYTLYLYSSKGTDTSGNAVDGNARFTVGGVTKTADETWNMRDAKVVARFDVTSDENGEITGTFAAGDADTSSLATSLQGGAFNGLTLVGDMPDYTPPGFMVILK